MSQILQSLHCLCCNCEQHKRHSRMTTGDEPPQCIVVVVEDHTRVISFLWPYITNTSSFTCLIVKSSPLESQKTPYKTDLADVRACLSEQDDSFAVLKTHSATFPVCEMCEGK